MPRDLIFKGQFRLRQLVLPVLRGNLLGAACFAWIFAFPEAAQALPEPGPTASASISISVSVAKRYGLAATTSAVSEPQGPRQPDTGQFCISTNGDKMHLPVMLIWPAPGQEDKVGRAAEDKSMLLPPCGASPRRPDAMDAVFKAAGMREVIVRPE